MNNKFAIKLADYCLNDLKLRIANKPTPPENWSRQVPKSSTYKKQWSILKVFIESPVQQVFDYARRQAERQIMENAIDSVVIDLKYVTLKKASPHTLRITKTQNEFEDKLKEWHQYLELLQQLKIKFSQIL